MCIGVFIYACSFDIVYCNMDSLLPAQMYTLGKHYIRIFIEPKLVPVGRSNVSNRAQETKYKIKFALM